MKKKILSIVTILTLTLGVVGCAGKVQKDMNGDEIFVQTFQTSINERWKKQAELEEKYKKDTTFTEEEYTKETIKVLEDEVNALEEKQNNIEDKDLKSYAKDYVEGVKKQIEASKTNDYELQDKYIQESDKLRKPALIAMVDDYGVKIDEEHEQTYKDFKEKATIIKKENESQDFADKLATEMEFEKTTDEFGYVEFTTTVENTSEFNFKYLSYNVQYKDEDGVAIGNDIIYLENFNKDSKQKVKLSPFEEGIKDIVVTTDWFETE